MDSQSCSSILGLRHGARSCEGRGAEQVATSALREACTLLTDTRTHVGRGENTKVGGMRNGLCPV